MKKLIAILTLAFSLIANAQNYDWAKAIGGTSSDEARSIVTDASGNVYVTGYFSGTVDFDPSANTANLTSNGFDDIYIAKYDTAGNYVWAKKMGGTTLDIGISIASDASGNIYVTGYFSGTVDFDPLANTANLTSNGFEDIYIAKYDTAGNYVWAKKMGGTSYEIGISIASDASGNVYVTGSFQGTADFDPSANTANLTATNGSSDIYIAKYDTAGNYVWAKAIGGTGAEQGHSILTDASGNIYVTGSFRDIADFDPSANTANLTAHGGHDDVFIAKYNAGGNYVWAKNMGGTRSNIGYSIASDASGNVYVTGSFQGTADFDPSTNTANLISLGGSDVFIAKYFECVTITSTQHVSVCDSYDFNGTLLTQSGTYKDTLINSQGCDSIITLNLMIKQSTSSTQHVSVCDSYDFNGTLLTQSGTYIDTLKNTYGCDSIITLNLTLKKTTSTQNISTCNSYDFNGTLLMQSGTYKDTLINSQGCDSIITLSLTIKQPTTSMHSASICFGNSFTFNGKAYTTGGTYYDTLQNSIGCDSIIILTLIENQLPTPAISQNGNTLSTTAFASYQWFKENAAINGATAQNYTVTANGNYSVYVTNANGCSDTSAAVNVVYTGMNEVAWGASVGVYPNPTGGELNITAHTSGALAYTNIIVQIFSLHGQEIYNGIMEEETLTLNLKEKVSAGLYFVKLTNTNQESIIRKIVFE